MIYHDAGSMENLLLAIRQVLPYGASGKGGSQCRRRKRLQEMTGKQRWNMN